MAYYGSTSLPHGLDGYGFDLAASRSGCLRLDLAVREAVRVLRRPAGHCLLKAQAIPLEALARAQEES
jgi:hypothetical protein